MRKRKAACTTLEARDVVRTLGAVMRMAAANERLEGGSRMKKMLVVGAAVAALAVYAPAALAHPHQAEPAHNGAGQVIANGQNHAPFSSGVTCGGDPAAYGLESAHHGPDAGTPGKADGCYQTTGGVAPGADDENPALG